MDYRERWELKDYMIGRVLERRILLFQVAVVLVLVGFLLNFWYLQGVRGETYAHLAENNRLRRIPTMPARGAIFDRHDVVLAATRPSLDLVFLRENPPHVEAQLHRLVPLLGVSYEELTERLERMKGRPRSEPLVLREDVELAVLAQIEARRELFPSLDVREGTRRNYLHGELFGHVMGYVGEATEAQLARQSGGLQLGDIVGRTGLELGNDEWLRGRRGWNLVSVNNLGRQVGDSWIGKPPEHGNELRLTLDIRLQRELLEALGDEVGAGVFMDPRNGEILALVSTPSFDPGLFADGMTAEAWKGITEDPRRPLHDRAIASYYAPGSVFKVLMAIAGLETATTTTGHTVRCSGSIKVHDRERLCWRRGGHGKVNLRSALAHSCNVYFYLLGKQLGIDPIHEYGARFGLGRPTGIDLPGEAGGILPSRAWKREHLGEPWYPGDTISVAIGQGLLAVTPIQLATMISAVATGGRKPTPHLMRDKHLEPEELNVRPETFRIVQQALRDAVEQGTGSGADLVGVAVAGKTGTAQVYRHSAGVDSEDLPKEERDHAWFVGYAPAEDPTIAFAVVVEHGGHGGAAAAPVVRRVLEVFFSPRSALPDRRRAANADRGIPEDESDATTPPAG